MRTLHLTIKKEHFNAILSGEKKQYANETRPTAIWRYCEYDSNGELLEPKQYDALRIAFAHTENKDWLEVEITGAVVEQDVLQFGY